MMLKPFLATCALCLLTLSPAHAEERVTLGWGRMFTNDALGDGQDRWHTGSYTISRLRGVNWTGDLPSRPGEILEFRLRAETIAPANLITPEPDDRRYAGALSLGLYTHFDWQGFETSIGGDLVFTGPQTGIGGFQAWAHQTFGLPDPAVLDDQIGNAVYPTLVAEMGRSFALGETVRLRPFVEAQAGVETMVRAGGDLVIGSFGRDALMLRDKTTGQRYRGIGGDQSGALSFTLGGDVAHVFDSALLPGGEPATLTDTRTRLRAGVHWQGRKASVFYGMSYLGPEFDQQSEGQIVGALNLNFKF